MLLRWLIKVYHFMQCFTIITVGWMQSGYWHETGSPGCVRPVPGHGASGDQKLNILLTTERYKSIVGTISRMSERRHRRGTPDHPERHLPGGAAQMEADEFPSRNRQIWSRYGTHTKNSTAGIGLIFRGLNFTRNADIGQIGHLWMDTDEVPLSKVSPNSWTSISEP
jgi:hypothetical protein